MAVKSDLHRRGFKRGIAARVMVVVLVLQLTGLYAADRYLKPGQPDGTALLPPPPAADSAEQVADLGSVRAVFTGRSAAEEAQALKDASLSFSIFSRALGPVLQESKLPKTMALLQQVKKEMGTAIDTPKELWKRKRPYALDPSLSIDYLEPSFSYPSGHSTRGTAYALVLAQLFPQKREAILQVGREIGWDRVIIAKHFPTDVYAGRVLGKAIFRELMASPAFQHDLAEARAEIQATRQVAVEAH